MIAYNNPQGLATYGDRVWPNMEIGFGDRVGVVERRGKLGNAASCH